MQTHSGRAGIRRARALTMALMAVTIIVNAPRIRAEAADDGAPRMPMAEFKKHLAAGDILVIDVRGQEAYRLGHIPGAISVPYPTVEAKAPGYKGSKKPIVAYCA